MGSYRTNVTQQQYDDWKLTQTPESPCALCEKPSLQDFRQWRIVENAFPYDKIAIKHDQLITKLHVGEQSLNEEEEQELKEIKRGFVNENYSYVLEPVSKGKTIPVHHHLHLMVGKYE